MSRLDGGVGMPSSTSRSCRRSRSRPGIRLAPAPAGVPVERLVGRGLVRPLTVRPAFGVCASSRSRPVPPARGRGAVFERRCAAPEVFFLAGDGFFVLADGFFAVFRLPAVAAGVFLAGVRPARFGGAFRAVRPGFRAVLRLVFRVLSDARAAFLAPAALRG